MNELASLESQWFDLGPWAGVDSRIVQGVRLTFAALCQLSGGMDRALGLHLPAHSGCWKLLGMQAACNTLHTPPPPAVEMTGSEIHGKRFWTVEFAASGN